MTETEMLRAQVDSLTKQLAAATNDAARLEEQVQALTVERDFARKEFHEQLQATFSRMEERDAASADAARLRDTAERWLAAKRAAMEDESREARDAEEAPRMEFFKALAATDSAEWLRQRDRALIRRALDVYRARTTTKFNGGTPVTLTPANADVIDEVLRGGA